MTGHLSPQFPLEILVRIGSFLPFKDHLKFASINSQLHQIISPKLFAAARITNRKEDLDIVSSVATKYARHIRHLHFQCYLYQDPLALTQEDLQAQQDEGLKPRYTKSGKFYNPTKNRPCILPDAIATILSGENLVSMQAMTIEFLPEDDFDGERWGDEGGSGSIYVFSDVESPEKILEKERSFLWRQVMYKVWHAVTSNTSIRSLEVLQLIPRELSLWGTPRWNEFLSRLHELSIGFWGGDNGAGWHANCEWGYLDFLSRLHEFFLNHCTNLTHLEIAAAHGNPYGGTDMHCVLLGLHRDHLYNLKVLELRNCFIDGPLITFLDAHSKTLQRLALLDCTSSILFGDTSDVNWALLFKSIRETEPILRSLVVTNTSVPLTEYEEYENRTQPDEASDEVKAIRQAVSLDERKLFSYSNMDDKYGMHFLDEESNVERYKEGSDQHEYDELLSLVKQNAAAYQQSHTADIDLYESGSLAWESRQR